MVRMLAGWLGSVILVAGLMGSCKSDPKSSPPPAAPSMEDACKSSSGTWDATTKACRCPPDRTLRIGDGTCQIQTQIDTTTLQARCESARGRWDAAARTCVCETGKRWDGSTCVTDPIVNPVPSGGITTSALEEVCRSLQSSGAAWDSANQRCVCPTGQTLIGRACQAGFAGVVTADICQSAVYPGRYENGVCACDSRQAFALDRGGCPPALTGGGLPADRTTFDQICRSSGGAWDGIQALCQCPAGQVLTGRLCLPGSPIQGQETQAVCEGAIFRGLWNGGRCTCTTLNIPFFAPRGGCVVMSQGSIPVVPGNSGTTPIPPSGIDPNSEIVNRCTMAGGRWDVTLGRCDCGLNRIVVSGTCTTWSGIINAPVCAGALAPGVWNGATCTCSNGIPFNALAGGCLTAVPGQQLGVDSAELARRCAATLGRWDPGLATCVCPTPRANVGGYCQ